MIAKYLRMFASVLTAICLTVTAPLSGWAQPRPDHDDFPTTTPIKHVVVIFQENISFDHYFATYPDALNKTPGEPKFFAKDDTPTVNNLLSGGLLTNNPNTVQPFRLSRAESNTCDQNHAYLPEQQAVDHGLLDNYVAATGSGNSNKQTASTLFSGPGTPPTITPGNILLPGQYNKSVVTGGNSTTGPFSFSGYCFDAGNGTTTNKGVVMGYYDGNTVTAMWNYAQNFAMSDNSWSTSFGPSAPGAINLVAGTMSGATMVPKRPNGTAAGRIRQHLGRPESRAALTGALIGDARPAYDDCVGQQRAADQHQPSRDGSISRQREECWRPDGRYGEHRQGNHLGMVHGGIRSHHAL